MEENPFVIGKAVEGNFFTDRAADVEHLEANLVHILVLAFLLIAGAALTSCSNSDNPDSDAAPGFAAPNAYALTIRASKSSGDALTRALEEADGSMVGEKMIISKWTENDAVSVYKGETLLGTLTAKNVSADGKSCELQGSLDTAPDVDDVLTLKYQSPSYNDQDGTLTGTDHSIDKTCDYATATVTVKTVDTTNKTIAISESSASFTNQQAIVKFVLQKDDGYPLSKPSAFSIAYGAEGSVSLTSLSGNLHIENLNGTNYFVLYVAVPGFSNQDVKLTAIVGSNTYTLWKSGVTFANNKYYPVHVKMFDPYSTPLTIEAAVGGCNVTVKNYLPFYYKINIIYDWKSYDGSPITLQNKGDKVSFICVNSNSTNNGQARIVCDGDCYVYGNAMSLMDQSYATNTNPRIEYDNAFERLFYDDDNPSNSTHIFSHPSKELVLPATTLIKYCYKEMFKGCTNLKRAPELPASFVPEYGYFGMFEGCTNLNYIKCLATSKKDFESTAMWVKDVAATGTFVVNNTLTITGDDPTKATVSFWDDYRNDNGIPTGWTVTK